MRSQECRKTFAADFLFTLDDEGDIAWKLSSGLEVRFDGLEVRKVLAFVVASAPSENGTTFNAGFERRRFPKLERFGRLNVVVPVDDKMGAAASPGLR